MIGLPNGKSWLTFSDNPLQDLDFESLFHFAQHCRTGHFRRLIRSSHKSRPSFMKLSEMMREWIHYVVGVIWWTPDPD